MPSYVDPPSSTQGGAPPATTTPWRPAKSDADELLKENNKNVAALKGSAVFNVANDPVTVRFGCVRVHPALRHHLSSKAPKDVKITGLWYAQLSKFRAFTR